MSGCCNTVEELEANIDENRRSAEMLELQETLCWPTLAQLDSGAYIPEVTRGRGLGKGARATLILFILQSLVPQLSQQLLPGVLASKDRQLVHNGPLKLLDNKHRPPRDVVVFLFTDLLLVTQQNTTSLKGTKKEVQTCPCIYIHVHTCPCIYIHVHTCPCIYTHVHTCTHMSMHIHTCTHMSMHIHTCTHMSMHIHTCTCIYIHVHTCIPYNYGLHGTSNRIHAPMHETHYESLSL